MKTFTALLPLLLKRLLPAASSVFLLCSCVTEPSLYTGESENLAYTWEQELQLGREADKEIVQQMGLYPDEEVARYVEKVSMQILSQSAIKSHTSPTLYRETEFSFRVLDSPVVNAFALPGGYVYVTRGLLAHIENEAQLAVVIGHEITHIEARHASKQALKQQLGQIGLLAGAVISENAFENKELAQKVINVSGSLFQLITLKYGRDAERESDLHGVEYAAKAGYDAAQGSAFFRSLQRISQKSGQSLPDWMSSHPDPGEREQTVLQLAQQWSQPTKGNHIGREEYLHAINGLAVGSDPRNGFLSEGVFYHPKLNFQLEFPTEWKWQSEANTVAAQPSSGQAGLLVRQSNAVSAIEAANQLKAQVKLTPSATRSGHINSHNAYFLEGYIENESSITKVYAVFIESSKRVIELIGFGSSEEFTNARSAIAKSVNTFDTIQSQAAKSIQPARIEIRQAPQTAPFRTLLPDKLPSDTDPLDWAIMNQVDLDEVINKGRKLKLPAF